MDEYKELYYHRNPHARLEAFGDVTDRRKLRTQLGCKDFKWYLENIYPDIHVPEDRPGTFGMLKNRGMSSYCFDYNPPDDHNLVGHRIILYPCHGMGQNQFFEYSSKRSEIRYNTRDPAGCAVGDAVSTYLTVHLCKNPRQPVPQDQKFVLREAPGAGGRMEEGTTPSPRLTQELVETTRRNSAFHKWLNEIDGYPIPDVTLLPERALKASIFLIPQFN
ncbi:unnamed protein product [Oncorhynchus mykiss]|uniref:Ricin B lectin domain-containing protein n=1 Tax=Oncorhynchus mykiss TaxID=8022 RepID=A0A060XJ20_ONCMY|nr:unnamed protein product [Oncorhynchus mykiss]